jgi:hypothetical protein
VLADDLASQRDAVLQVRGDEQDVRVRGAIRRTRLGMSGETGS